LRGARFLECALHSGRALAPELRQDMLFGGEIIEKGPLSYIGRFGDVLHGGFQETARGKEGEGCAVQSIAGFSAMAFAAATARGGFDGRGSEG
jgi:hypothetical protein